MAEYTISKIKLPNGDICNIKDTTYNFNTAYNATTNKAATMADIKTDNIKPIKSASFTTGKYGQDGSGTHFYEMLGSITPSSFEQMWLLHYIITIEVPNDTTYTYRADVEIYGVRNTYAAYKIFNSYYSRYPIYQHVILEGASSSYPHEFGYRLSSSYGDTTLNKNIHIDIIETRNCTATFFNAPKAYDSSTPSNYTFRTFNATSNGLQESGDADTITRLYAGNNTMKTSTTMRLAGTSLFGFDRENHAQTISLYNDGYTSTTISINTARVYNSAGFDWTKGLLINQSSNCAPGTEVIINIDQSYHAMDFRYTDNCVASASLSTLGLERYKAVYLRGTLGTDGLFYLAPLEVTYNNTTYKRAWTQDPSNSNYVYWFLGFPYYNSSYAGGYQLNFYLENKLYQIKNNKLQEYVANAATADAFSSNKTVALTGDVTGTTSGTNGWSIATTIGEGKVTNAMLAGSIANGKLANSSIKIGNKTISLGGSATLSDIGVSYPVTSVAGKTGAVTLVKGDVGLGNVDNTADANKTVKYANMLTGMNSQSSNMGWGNQTGTVITCLTSSGGGGWGFRDNNPASGQMSMTIDGTIYIKEGAQDISAAVKSFSVSGQTVTYTNLWGGTGTFTTQDTKNTAGSTNSFSKLYLIGATSQATNPTTNSYQYTYTNNGLLSALKVGLNLNGTEKAHLEWNNTDQSIDFIFD